MKRRNSFGFIFAGIIFLSLVVIVGAVNWIPAAYNVTYYASEDTVYHHNLSANISNGGAAVSFQILPDSQSPLIWNGTSYVTNVVSSWIYIANSTTGDLVINVTRNNQTGNFTIPLYVSSGGGGETQSFNFSVSAVNDKPQFVNLVNKTMNATESFNYIINTSDEENISGASLNLTFLGDCVPAQWTNRYNNNSVGNCTLFGNNNYVFNNNTGQINITFTPSRDNDVGVYHLNFTLSDAANASVKTSKDVYFTVLNVNQYPRFNYVCNNERNWTEGNIVSCWINVTDPDEINNLTLSVQTPKTINSSAVGSPANWFNFVGGSSSMTKNVSSATGFNASFPVNFSVGNNEVGNWFINFTLTDTGSPARMNSTLINFSVVNVNDNVSMDNVSDMVLATTSNYALNVLAHDNDLLINDKSVYNENLTFTSNTSWIGLVSTSTTLNSNLTTALFGIYPSLAGPGTYAVNISVRDKNNYSMDSKVFSITIIANNPPSWNANTNSNITVLEGTNIYLNLSKNVTDLDHDTLNFSYSPTDCFDGLSNFSLNSSTGIINFTTDDVDVGEHLCNITVTDTKFASANLLFNFTINNLDENVTIHRPIRNMGSSNASLSVDNLTSNITITEDDIATVQFNASDSDLRIVQKNFCANCNQSLNVNLTLLSAPIGANANLLNFVLFNSSNEYRIYNAVLTPKHTDLGLYQYILNVSDGTGFSDAMAFNVSVLAVPHAPVMDNIPNQSISFSDNFYYDVNSTDVEDGTDAAGKFSYFINPLNGGNFLVIDGNNGIIANSTNVLAGVWNYNVRVMDSSGLNDSKNFTLRVYDYPKILLPLVNTVFNLSENNSFVFNFSANHSVGDSLNYSIYLNGVWKNSTLGYGNGTNVSLAFTPWFDDETTCSGKKNLTLVVSNARLSNSTNMSLNISHTNYPLTLFNNIPDQQFSSSVTLTLSNYFYDLDAIDSCINQSINFSANLRGNNSIHGIEIINWINGTSPKITFSDNNEFNTSYFINATEYDSNNMALGNVVSNNFTLTLTKSAPEVVTITVPSSGGGGGGSGATRLVPVVLRILTPGPINSDKKDNLSIPITLFNSGDSPLSNINLSSMVTLNGTLVSGISSYFDNSFIGSLAPGARVNTTLNVLVNTETQGNYEININASVQNPSLTDSATVYLNVKEGASVEKKILFIDQLMVDNPECAEINEIINEAKSLLDAGKINEAEIKTDEAINSCRKLIQSANSVSGFNGLNKVLESNRTVNYSVILSVVAIILGFVVYMFKRIRLRRDLMGYE